MYDNEFETKENKIQTKDKIEPQHKHAEGKIFRSGITAISFPSSTSHSFLPNAFLFWAFFWASFLGIKYFHNDLNGKKLHFILNMKLLVSSFAAAQAEVKQCCSPLHLGRNVWLWPSAWAFFKSVSGADCGKAFTFTLHKYWTTIKYHWFAGQNSITGDLSRLVKNMERKGNFCHNSFIKLVMSKRTTVVIPSTSETTSY